MIQTLRLDSAARITAVMPYLSYARSDKKDQPRVPITARLVADMIEVAGRRPLHHPGPACRSNPGLLLHPRRCADRLPHLDALTSIGSEHEMLDPVVVTADLGFAKKGRNFAAGLNASMAFIEKRRTRQ